MTTVSVIVPTYNRRDYLPRALQSIWYQTFKDYEVIVINDSGENVADIVKLFDGFTLIEHEENKGLSASRNTGLRAAKGKYICFLDDDDVIFPDHLQTLVDAMDAGAMVAYTGYYIWDMDAYMRPIKACKYSREMIHKRNLFPVMCVMVREELFVDCLFDETLNSHEDYDMWLRLSEKVDRFECIDKKTAAYSKRGGQDQISYRDYHAEAKRKVFSRYA
jgi:glycosyltransferase involved in cell wall biosynthesis